jgi:hypothetical protein
MLSPTDMVIPGQEIYETEYQLDVTQLHQWEAFQATAKGAWTLSQMKSDPFRFWRLTNVDVTIDEFVLSAALRLAKGTER